jgi:hypothetical protein
MAIIDKEDLRRNIVSILHKQGYKIQKANFVLENIDREKKRDVHALAKYERISKHKYFICRNSELVKQSLLDGEKLVVDRISPRLIEVNPGSKWETLFRWWNLVWWSLPYERAYGRQIRYIVWDQYHNAPIGLIGLQSPILSWSVRDSYLGIPKETRDYWVNQSLSAQRLGALPPYNYILGGKLVAYLMTTDTVRERFARKYAGLETVIKKRKLPARLLFITTTGAYGKSSVYTRLKYDEEYVARFIGYTQGSGSFHIPLSVFENLMTFLRQRGYDVQRGYGTGPSRKLRLIEQALKLLGFDDGASHGIKRAVYLFPLAKNLHAVIQNNSRPIFYHRTIDELTGFWKQRWALPKINKDPSYLEFRAENLIKTTLTDLNSSEKTCRG